MPTEERSSRFHVLMGEAVREYEMMQAMATVERVEASGTTIPMRSPSAPPLRSPAAVRPPEAGNEPIAARLKECSWDRHKLHESDELRLADQEGSMWEADFCELQATQTSENEKPWVYDAWANFAVDFANKNHSYVLRPYWAELQQRSAPLCVHQRSSIKYVSEASTEEFDMVRSCWLSRPSFPRGRKGLSQSFTKSLTLDLYSPAPTASRCMVHPDSLFRVIWSVIGMLFMTLDLLYVTMSAFGITRSRSVDVTDGMYWTLDLLLCCRTGTYLNGDVNLNAITSMRSYLCGWFSFDVTLVVYQWVMIAVEAAERGQEAKFIRFTRFARYTKLLRLTKLQMMMYKVWQRIDNIYVLLVLRLVFYTVGLAFYVHVSASIWFTIGHSDQAGWVRKYDGLFEAWPASYIGSFSWAVTQLQGSNLIMSCTLTERAVSSVHYMVSIMVLALFGSNLTTVLQAIADAKAKEADMMRIAYTFMKNNKIGVELRVRLQRFLMDKASVGKQSQDIDEQSELLRILPRSLRQALMMEVRMPVVGQGLLMASFALFHHAFIEHLACDFMYNSLHSPGERVFQQGRACNRMYFLDAGVAWYLPCSPVVARLKDAMKKQSPEKLRTWCGSLWQRRAYRLDDVGTLWCEGALFVDWTHTGDLEADPNKAMSCLVLDAQAFEDLVRSFKEVHTALIIHATRFCTYLAANAHVTDLFNSESIMT